MGSVFLGGHPVVTWSILPKQILYSQLRERSRKTGWQKLRHTDFIKRNLGVMNIPKIIRKTNSKIGKTGEKKKQNKTNKQRDVIISIR